MEVVAVMLPFVLLGAAVLFVAFSGGPSAARQAYLTRGGRGFRIAIAVIYIGLGVGVPAAILATRQEATGGTGKLRKASLAGDAEAGKMLFRQKCATCHSLAAVNARGVAGPDLDALGELTPERVRNAIKIGGTGERRMPAGLLEGQEARDVAVYVSKVAGR